MLAAFQLSSRSILCKTPLCDRNVTRPCRRVLLAALGDPLRETPLGTWSWRRRLLRLPSRRGFLCDASGSRPPSSRLSGRRTASRWRAATRPSRPSGSARKRPEAPPALRPAPPKKTTNPPSGNGSAAGARTAPRRSRASGPRIGGGRSVRGWSARCRTGRPPPAPIPGPGRCG